jgi:hypothetical protein
MDTLIALKEAMDTAQSDLDAASTTFSVLIGEERTLFDELRVFEDALAVDQASLGPGMSQAAKDAAEASLKSNRDNCNAKRAEHTAKQGEVEAAIMDRRTKSKTLTDAKAAYEQQLESL